MWVSGGEVILLASSLEQARIVFRVVRAELEPKGGYRWVDSTQRIGCTHLATNTRLRVISSNAKSAMGILGVGLVVLDEPGAGGNRGLIWGWSCWTNPGPLILSVAR